MFPPHASFRTDAPAFFRGTSASRPIFLFPRPLPTCRVRIGLVNRHVARYRILPARIAESAPGRFRFSIKRKNAAPKETPHPENPACNKRRFRHTSCPNHHSIHLKYHRNCTLSSQKCRKNAFFGLFFVKKGLFRVFHVDFAHARALAHAYPYQ